MGRRRRSWRRRTRSGGGREKGGEAPWPGSCHRASTPSPPPDSRFASGCQTCPSRSSTRTARPPRPGSCSSTAPPAATAPHRALSPHRARSGRTQDECAGSHPNVLVEIRPGCTIDRVCARSDELGRGVPAAAHAPISAAPGASTRLCTQRKPLNHTRNNKHGTHGRPNRTDGVRNTTAHAPTNTAVWRCISP